MRGPASNLELWLLVDRETLTGYERELIDALFFSKKATSTDAVREKYKSVGFDPAQMLKAPLGQQSNALLGIRPILGWPTWLALASAIVGLVLSLRLGDSGILPVVLAASVGLLGPLWGSALFAEPWGRSVQEPMVKAWPFVAFSGLSVSGLGLLVAFWAPLHSIAALCFVWWGVTGAMVVARAAASRESPRGFALRRNLLAARGYFAEELARPEPRIQDAWLPYLIAFELTSEMDAWQRAFGTVTSTYRPHSSPHRSDWNDTPAPSSAPSSGWTGGGGCFGGAGASGSWAAAAAGLTVASPHAGTTSSSTSSGSTSSSSGGGGGGGW